MKKILILFSLLFIINVSSFGQIFEKGLELTDKMFIKSENSEILNLFLSNSSDTVSYYNSIKDNLSKSDLVNCYEVNCELDKLIIYFLDYEGNDNSEAVEEYFNENPLINLYISMLNGLQGSDVLTLSTIFNCNSLFDDQTLKENKCYLYIFKNSYPIIVNFRKGEDKAVYATASYIFYKNLIDGKKNDILKVMNDSFEIVTLTKIK